MTGSARASNKVAVGCLAAVVAVGYLRAQDAQPVPSTRAVLDQYCVTCHNQRLKTAGLQLDTVDPENVAEAQNLWEKVASKLRTREMPPSGRPRPEVATYSAVASRLERSLDLAAAARPNPGRVAVHRLNRAEYTNAVRDLLGLEVNARELLPDDSNQESFDNIASVLSVSPALIEGYLSAATKISRLAVGDLSTAAVVETYRVPKGLVQDDRVSDDLPFGSQGGAVFRHHFPVDGEYTIKVTLRRELYYYIIGMGDAHQIDVRLDGALVKRFDIGGAAPGKAAPESFIGQSQGDPEWEKYMQTADEPLQVRIPVKAGVRDVAIVFVGQRTEPSGILQPPERGFARSVDELYHGHPAVDTVLIGGPYAPVGTGDTVSRRHLFLCHPKSPREEEPCAKQILSTIARRAYRRPVTPKDVERLVAFYEAGRAEGGFEAGIQQGLERILSAPSFVFRIEHAPPDEPAGSPYRLSDLDLASRLSFFLWSSIPDDELMNVALQGGLKDPNILGGQIRRMLADQRSQALVDNFATQWLSLGKLTAIVPDVDAYPEFDENLRNAMVQETKLFIASQLRDDRSVMELLTADYTFLNERLAVHYGIPNIYGERFRRVVLRDKNRGGLLGQASVLAVTSYPNRTSPVLRGKWILANLLGAPPPPPPPNVPALPEPGAEGQPASIRARMEVHRKNPVCASCHSRMDPLGFSLENFDGLGKWRAVSDGAPVDATATLPDGSTFQGVAGLRSHLVIHSEDFVRTLSEKLLSYSIGRVVESYDRPAVREISRAAGRHDYRWSSLIAAIAESTPFAMGIVPKDATDEIAASAAR